MKHSFSLRRFADHTIIIISLLLLIFLPRVLFGWFYLGQAQKYSTQSSHIDAAIAYEDAARRLWWINGLFEQAAQSSWQAGDAHAALHLFEIAQGKDGLTSGGKLTIGDAYSQTGDIGAAVAAWESIELGTPDYASALSRLAIAYRRAGNTREAMEAWQTILKIEPQNGEAHYNLGLFLMTVQPEDALPEFMLALSLDQEFDEKVQVLRQGLNLAFLQDNAAYQLVLSGRSLASIGAWDLALQAFLQASKVDPEFSEAWAWQGEAYQQLGQDGFPALKKALDLDQNSVMSLALSGLYFRRHDQIDQAWSFYSRAATLDPSNFAWQEVLGELSAQKGDLIDALNYYQKAVDLSPQNPASWRAMALFCLQYNVNVAELGVRAALQVLKLEPASWRSYDIMGQVLMVTGDLETAARYFNQSISSTPEQSESYLHLGYLHLLQDRRDEAYNNLVKAHRLDPDGSIGLQAQRLLDQYYP